MQNMQNIKLVNVNGRCNIALKNIGTDKYTYYLSKEWYLRIEENDNALAMFATKEGELEILVKNNFDLDLYEIKPNCIDNAVIVPNILGLEYKEDTWPLDS